MGFFEEMDQRANKFDLMDITLAQGAALFFAFIVASQIPQIMNIHWGWFIVLSVLCTARPTYRFWFKK